MHDVSGAKVFATLVSHRDPVFPPTAVSDTGAVHWDYVQCSERGYGRPGDARRANNSPAIINSYTNYVYTNIHPKDQVQTLRSKLCWLKPAISTYLQEDVASSLWGAVQRDSELEYGGRPRNRSAAASRQTRAPADRLLCIPPWLARISPSAGRAHARTHGRKIGPDCPP